MKKLFLFSGCFFLLQIFAQKPLTSVSKSSIDIITTKNLILRDTFYIYNKGTTALTWNMSSAIPGVPSIIFTKANNADWTLPANQDSIAIDVRLTRTNTQGIFNISKESSYQAVSPVGTKWSGTNTLGSSSVSYTTWTSAWNNNPAAFIGKSSSMICVSTGKFYDIKLLSFSGGGTGGGFSWIRTEKPRLRANIVSGNINANDSVMIIISDTAGSNFGKVSYSLIINSNDSSNLSITIPYTRTIIKQPRATITFPDSINFSLYKHELIRDTVVFGNTGDTSLNWSVTKPSWVNASASGSTAELNYDTLIITIDANKIHAGDYSDTLKIITNDPLKELTTIFLKGVVKELKRVNPLKDISLTEGFKTFEIAIDTVFQINSSDSMIYTISVPDTSYLSGILEQNKIIITEKGVGNTVVIVSAKAGNSNEVKDTFNIHINQKTILKDISGSFSVFPNPSDNAINIKSDFKGVIKIEIIDMNGVVHKCRQFTIEDSDIIIDIHDLSAGMYVIKIKEEVSEKSLLFRKE